jgi:hypothetical protein
MGMANLYYYVALMAMAGEPPVDVRRAAAEAHATQAVSNDTAPALTEQRYLYMFVTF